MPGARRARAGGSLTVVTKDHSLSAHGAHGVVTDAGTKCDVAQRRALTAAERAPSRGTRRRAVRVRRAGLHGKTRSEILVVEAAMRTRVPDCGACTNHRPRVHANVTHAASRQPEEHQVAARRSARGTGRATANCWAAVRGVVTPNFAYTKLTRPLRQGVRAGAAVRYGDRAEPGRRPRSVGPRQAVRRLAAAGVGCPAWAAPQPVGTAQPLETSSADIATRRNTDCRVLVPERSRRTHAGRTRRVAVACSDPRASSVLDSGLELLAHLRIATAPEAREIARHLTDAAPATVTAGLARYDRPRSSALQHPNTSADAPRSWDAAL